MCAAVLAPACDDAEIGDEAGLVAAEVGPAGGRFDCDADEHPTSTPRASLDEVAQAFGVADLAAFLGTPRARTPVVEIDELAADDGAGEPQAAWPDIEIPPVGSLVQRSYYKALLHPFRVCDGDGTDCGQIDATGMRNAIDSLDAMQYRSEGRIRYAVDPTTNYAALLKNDGLNNTCKPKPNLGSYPKDANGDGTYNVFDLIYLCEPVDDNGLGETIGQMYDDLGSIVLYSRGGYKSVEWDDELGKYKANPHAGGSSSCSGHVVNLTKNFGGGTFVPHELGHYFCAPHTFGGSPDTLDDLEDEIHDHVTAGNALPTEKTKILADLYDGDLGVSYAGDLSYLNNFPVNDTPPDPDGEVFKDVYGSKCGLGMGSVTATVAFGAPYNQSYNYTLTPDRRNVMSYFKGCFGEQYHRYSSKQIARAHAAATGHRASVVENITVDGWENTVDVAIPPRGELGTGPLQWVSSWLKTTGAGSPTRVRVHVDIKHDTGGLNINLVTPNGNEVVLQTPAQNTGQVAGDVKTIFYVNGAGLPRDGLWRLKVAAEYASLDEATRKIDDWRIEFE